MYKLLISTYTILSFNLKISLDENGSFINASTNVAGAANVLNGATFSVNGTVLSGVNPALNANLSSQLDAIQKMQASLQDISNDVIAGQTQIGDARRVVNDGVNGVAATNNQIINKQKIDPSILAGQFGTGVQTANDTIGLFNSNIAAGLNTTNIMKTANDLVTAFNQTTGRNTNSLMDRISAFQSSIAQVTPTQAELQNPAYIQASNDLSNSLKALNDPNTGAIANLKSTIENNQVNAQKYNAELQKVGNNLSNLRNFGWSDPNNIRNLSQVVSALKSTILDGIKTDSSGKTQNDITITGDPTKLAPLSPTKFDPNSSTTTVDPKTSIDNIATAVAEVKAAIDKVGQDAQKLAITRAIISASTSASQASLNAAAQDAARRKNSTPTILPTAKAGLIAFFGKHQSVSVEYQYYFRNTNPSFTSGEVTLNYAYYFGGK
ncbi:hypothetical protein BKH43_08250 [Helicobacter sp. 13S00401-1]|uniref:hypothetical protein n=1 Tax=Helicobacter sp. 13S00401-1 TaxID=1905758 RepID=UPI000BA74DE9|nr:hypothetical protein [Helicobacter sp. 13S00401-1]PAF47030.1 hypothetical protein BKH43_08250 [Helicobacter sp. 13S00401-1]